MFMILTVLSLVEAIIYKREVNLRSIAQTFALTLLSQRSIASSMFDGPQILTAASSFFVLKM